MLAHAADNRGLTWVLVATFVVSGISLATFRGGVMRRLTASARPAAASTGYVAAAGVLTLFGVLVACARGPGIAAGELSGLFGLGLVGFLIWLAFLVTTGLHLVRADNPPAELITA